MSLQAEKILIFDGACGSNLQTMDIPTAAWDGREGCNEYLNVSAGEIIQQLHSDFLAAGCNVIETNTFGASRIVLDEYDLADRVDEINRAAVNNARAAVAASDRQAWVAGSAGPTTKLPSLGHISVAALAEAHREQFRALLDAGVDLLILETCQDLLQAKTAVIAARDVMDDLGLEVPLMVSLTIETTGTMLVGADIAAAATSLAPLGLFSLGLNCATGPAGMESHIRYLSHHWPTRISAIPNAGMPEVVDGQTCYRLEPQAYAEAMTRFVQRDGVSIVGGCCGTRPDHIAALVAAIDGAAPAPRDITTTSRLASGYQSVDIGQDPAPMMIGERCNANGSKRFRELLLAGDDEGCLKTAAEQEAAGAAHALDLCVAYAGRDEMADMLRLVEMFRESVKLPLVIDSTTPDVIEAALTIYPGRALINSINLEDGGTNLDRICRLARTYGAACIALTIGGDGMAMTADEKLAVARDIYDRAVNTHGLSPGDLVVDVLTFTIGSGDDKLCDAGIQTLEGIRKVKAELPGVFTTLGLSNISFGLAPASRRILNSVFLHEAIAAGLDTAIVDAATIIPLSQIGDTDRKACLDLIYDRTDAVKDPLAAFIEHFSEHTNDEDDKADAAHRPAEQALRDKVVRGDREGLEDLLAILMRRYPPVTIINTMLIPAMRHVGELFGRGDMLLPFVLQSAEVMKRAVDILKPHMPTIEEGHSVKVLLATVFGDVHDIGKNLVDIILSNNGYEVHNIGIKVGAETIIAKARELDVDVIGLSGLLVKSAVVMQDNMSQFAKAGLSQPILLGGAALTPKFVAEDCVPGYTTGKVVYCPDAFAGLRAMQDFEAGRLESTQYDADGHASVMKPGVKTAAVARDNPVPEPPFLGPRYADDLDIERLLTYVNEQALFRGRWGYRRGTMDQNEYQHLIAKTVRPMYEDLKRRSIKESLIQPQVAYGYFHCHSDGERLVVDGDTGEQVFTFPRQTDPPHLCISDYFRTAEEGGDLTALFVVTIGDALRQATQELFDGDEYHDYLVTHAFGVEVTDAVAEYWHEVMRGEMGFHNDRPETLAGYAVQAYRGSRYGFGYPACPDLDAHEQVFALLRPEDIGVTLTETMEMVPEMSTSAIVAHHPQAKYFAV
ncbi:MAG: methionine synthase [Planctomycetes bacterium]|jgi:5-methyltetrahydrofolate--homocysteine methyltransferase|nr:methionine synthase [Planctomycetota bacterium]